MGRSDSGLGTDRIFDPWPSLTDRITNRITALFVFDQRIS